MAITQEEVVRLYDELIDVRFDGIYRGTWQSRNSWDPQIRDVIVTPQLEEGLQETITAMHERLEGQVWKGFIPDGRGWKFFVILDGNQNIGDEGKYSFKDFEVFHITKQCQEHRSRRGVSITVKLD